MVDETKTGSSTQNGPTTLHAESSSEKKQLSSYPALPTASASRPVDMDESSSRSTDSGGGQQQQQQSPAPSGDEDEHSGSPEPEPMDIATRTAAIVKQNQLYKETIEQSQAEFDKRTEAFNAENSTLRYELNIVNDEKSRALVENDMLRKAKDQADKRVVALRQELQTSNQQYQSENYLRISLEQSKSDLLKQKAYVESSLHNERAISKKHEAVIEDLDKQVSALQQEVVDERTRRVCAENKIVGLEDELNTYKNNFSIQNAAEAICNNVMEAMNESQKLNNSSILDDDAVVAVKDEVNGEAADMVDGLTEQYNMNLRSLQATIAEKDKLLKEMRQDCDYKRTYISNAELEFRYLRKNYEDLKSEFDKYREKHLKDSEARGELLNHEREQKALQMTHYAELLKQQQEEQVTLKLLEKIVGKQEKRDETKALTAATSSPSNAAITGTQHRLSIKRKEAPGDVSASSTSSNSPAASNNNNSKRVKPAGHTFVDTRADSSGLLVSPARQLRPAHAGVTPLHANKSGKNEDPDASCTIM